MSEKEKKVRYLLQNDREFFFEFLLSHYIKTPQKPIADLHREWFELLDTEQFLAIAAPREHAKSAIVNLADNLFDICNHSVSVHQPYIIIISDTPEQAKEHLENIVEELEGNELLQKFYGKLYKKRVVGDRKKDKWTSDTIITANNVKVQAVGWRFKGRGKRRKQERPSKIVVDDGENDEDVNSEKMREKLNTGFMKKVMNMGSKDTKFRFIGTILHFDSFLNNLIKKPPEDFVTRLYTAIQKDGTVLWPEWWSLERLKKKRKRIGSIAFEQEFMNNPLDESKTIIKRDWIKLYDGHFATKGEKAEKHIYINNNQLRVYTCIDPNATEKQQQGQDDFAIVTIGLSNDGDVFVLDRVMDQIPVSKHVDLIIEKFKAFNSEIWVETVFYQEILAIDFNRKCAEQGLYPSIFTTKPYVDKIRRVTSTSSMYEGGHIYIADYMTDLIEQIVQFPKGAKDDGLDALTIGLQRIKLGVSGVGQSEKKRKKNVKPKMITSGLQNTNF